MAIQPAFRIFAFMADIKEEIANTFGGKLRLRISGVCFQGESILLVKHKSIGNKEILWAPPGGGMIYGESVTETLKREFFEETGLHIKVNKMILVNEYLESPLHAVELFFHVEILNGQLIKGTDPELTYQNQIISDVQFVSLEEIHEMDPEILHSLFKTFKTKEDFFSHAVFQQNIIK